MMAETDTTTLVEQYLKCWRTGDAAAFGPLFTEDAVYQDGPQPPVHGRDAIVAFIARVVAGFEFLGAEVRHLVAAGDVLLTERVDRARQRTTGREVTIPLAAVYEVRDGRFGAVRYYYDGRSLERQVRDERPASTGAAAP